MKSVKQFFIIFFLVISVVLMIGIFMDKNYHVERTITINTPAYEVFDYIRYLKNLDAYSFWSKIDPEMKRRYEGIDGTVGFTAYWSGNQDVGKGRHIITSIGDNYHLAYEIEYLDPPQPKVSASFHVQPIDQQASKVIWSMDGTMNYPLNILLPLIDMDIVLGVKLDAGLQNLKSIMDHKPDDPAISIPSIDSAELNE